MKSILSIAIFVVAFYLNVWKIPIFENLIATNGTYTIFPWMDDPGQTSGSSPTWLLLHLYFALYHLILTILRVLRIPDQGLHKISHWIFSAHVLLNIHHFGEAPIIFAIIANGIPLFSMNALYIYAQNRRILYLLAFTTPVFFEAALFLKAQL